MISGEAPIISKETGALIEESIVNKAFIFSNVIFLSFGNFTWSARRSIASSYAYGSKVS